MNADREREIPRRQFVRSAVAIGGASALAACAEREQSLAETTASGTVTDRTYPQGDPSALPEGQHLWSQYLKRDAAGNTVPPQQQLVLGLSYEGSSPPTDAERQAVEDAFDTLSRAFQWGVGGNEGATFIRGLLFLIGYAPGYYETVGAVPEAAMTAETLLESVGEDPTKTDDFDAVVVLTSDVGSVVLAAEEALVGNKERVNGVDAAGSITEPFSVAERRTGFAGRGIPADKLDNDAIPEEAPLSMGFKSGFTDSLPGEDAVTIDEGPLAGGTTLALSRLRLEIDRWYDQDSEDRVNEMFCPAHTEEEVGPVGTNLGASSGITEEDTESIEEHADEYNQVGHSQKVARARDEDFRPRILRRSEGFATDAPEQVGFNFSSVQRTFEAFVEARAAMNVDEYDVDVPPENHGIVDYVNTVDRGTYLVPSHADRALPVMEA